MQIVENLCDSTIETKNLERKSLLSARGTVTQVTDIESTLSERCVAEVPSNFDILT